MEPKSKNFKKREKGEIKGNVTIFSHTKKKERLYFSPGKRGGGEKKGAFSYG